MSTEGWIVHDEKRMHLPELTNHCVTCLQDQVIDLAERLVSKLEIEWWNCNGGTLAHDQIRAEQAEVQTIIDGILAARRG